MGRRRGRRRLTFRRMRREVMPRWVARCLILALVYLACLNLSVSALGGSTWALSPSHVGDKSRALARFVVHLPRHLWSNHDGDIGRLVRRAAARHGVPGAFALAIARAESSLRPHVVSHTGAMGIMQLMPDTALGLSLLDPFDPAANADAGARHLSKLWKRYRGSERRVAAAYNAGAGRVPRRGPLHLPTETRTYVARVLKLTAQHRSLATTDSTGACPTGGEGMLISQLLWAAVDRF